MSDLSSLARILKNKHPDTLPDYGLGPMTPATRAGRQNGWAQALKAPERPNDAMAHVAEAISPTMGAYGAGQMAAEGSRAIGQGDYLGGGAGLALGAAGLVPGVKAGGAARQLDNLGYYSQALEAAKAWPQTKGTPEQVLTWLSKSGAKQAEIDATGLGKALAGLPSVTRDEIIAHLEGNRVGMKEARYLPHSVAATMSNDELRSLAGSTKWSSYSLDPGNPSYRETVLHLPEGERLPPEIKVEQRGSDWAWSVRGDGVGMSGSEPTEAAARARIDREVNRGRKPLSLKNPNDFRSGHFPEPNIVGHMMSSMTKHEGRPVYTLDQIQSDWGQKLRDGGVRDEAKIADLRRRYEPDAAGAIAAEAVEWTGRHIPDLKTVNLTNKEIADLLDREDIGKGYSEDASIMREAGKFADRIRAAERDARLLRAELATAEAAAPGHPLVNTTDQWVNTTLRRALRQAAEADADYIAIPSGKTVESYNPQGDSAGNAYFYDQIVPKNLANILKKIDKASATKGYADTLETPTKGQSGAGFSLFNLPPEVRRKIMEGLPLFGIPGIMGGALSGMEEPNG